MHCAKRHSFLEFSLCLSRACLGKIIVFIHKWRKNGVFLPVQEQRPFGLIDLVQALGATCQSAAAIRRCLNAVFLAVAIWCDFDRGRTAVPSTAAKVALAAIAAGVASVARGGGGGGGGCHRAGTCTIAHFVHAAVVVGGT